MNLLTIMLTCSCNMTCPSCPMSQWKQPLHHTWAESEADRQREIEVYSTLWNYPIPMRANMIENKYLLPWLKKYCPPTDWLIELTGGEPALYPELAELITTLDSLGYTGIIRTNGTLPIPQFASFPRVCGWHPPADMPPTDYDMMLILDGTVDTEAKKAYCQSNNTPFLPIHANAGQKYSRHVQHIQHYAFMNAVGQLSPCQVVGQDRTDLEPNNIFNMTPPLLARYIRATCPFCVNVAGFEYVWDFLNSLSAE